MCRHSAPGYNAVAGDSAVCYDADYNADDNAVFATLRANRRVGERELKQSDLRQISSTKRNLMQLLEQAGSVSDTSEEGKSYRSTSDRDRQCVERGARPKTTKTRQVEIDATTTALSRSSAVWRKLMQLTL